MTEERAPYDVTDGLQFYLGVKQIKARPMALGDYNLHRGWTIPPDEDPARPGYLIVYPDSHQQWIPQEMFESAYLPMDGDGTKITDAMVDEFIVDTEVSRMGNHTVVFARLRNGFTVIQDSACVDPANYNEALGAKYALRKVRTNIYRGLGFVLSCARNGFRR
jgi:hypothetical protein